MKVLVYSAHPYEIPFLEKAAGRNILVFSDKKLSLDTAALAQGYEAIAIFTADDASAPVLQKLSEIGVRYIALRSAGYDHVDLNVARQLGFRVANVPAYSPYSVAEHAVALLLSLNRKIVLGQTLIRLQDFRLDSLVGFDIHGKTIGIIGTGSIGLAFAKIMNGFGVKIIAHDPVVNPEAVALGLQYVSLDDVLTRSDVLSLHCPLNASTRGMISAPQLARMKKTAIIINTSRGAVVNTEDLMDALENGRIGGACLDVYEYEKRLFFEDHRGNPLNDLLFLRLRANRNVIVTGHQGFLTTEALGGIADATLSNINYWEKQERSPNELAAVSSSKSTV